MRRTLSTKIGREKYKRKKWTLISISIYLVFGTFTVFFSQKVHPGLWVPAMLISSLIPFYTASLWFKLNQNKFWSELVWKIKIAVLGLPFMILVIFAKAKYQEFHLKNYRKLANGVILDTGSSRLHRGGTTYYARVLFIVNNEFREETCDIHPYEYHKGDSVFVAYSYEDEDFFELAGRQFKPNKKQ